jgi:hypothetical protein
VYALRERFRNLIHSCRLRGMVLPDPGYEPLA